MSEHGNVLTLRISRTPGRESWRAVIEELDICVPGLTANDALFALGQCLSSLAHDCMATNKNVLDLVHVGD